MKFIYWYLDGVFGGLKYWRIKRGGVWVRESYEDYYSFGEQFWWNRL